MAWKNAHWSPARDWCWAASDRWYIAWVISLDDNPAKAVARAVRATGVAVRIIPQTPFGFGTGAGAAGSVGDGSSTGGPPGSAAEPAYPAGGRTFQPQLLASAGRFGLQ